MTIITVTKTGAIRLPKDTMKLLGNPKHLQIRVSASGVTLCPVTIQPVMEKKAVPEVR